MQFDSLPVLRDEPLSAHTTFCVGGKADFFITLSTDKFEEQAVFAIKTARGQDLPVFILGGGANVLAADSGFRGLVLDTTDFSGCRIENSEIIANSGTKSDDVANFAAQNSICGFEFLAGLPGTIGGAVFMNARCYENSISDCLGDIFIINEDLKSEIVHFNAKDYGYKKSPFQNRNVLIKEVKLRSPQKGQKNNRAEIEIKMSAYRSDREKKGHYLWSSAGSVFKNNHDFGKPSGKIIEELGLRGTQIGGARIADWHGNFIINTGGASSKDIYALINFVQKTAKERLGIMLEPEIVFLGEF